jgi:hypothetical protein
VAVSAAADSVVEAVAGWAVAVATAVAAVAAAERRTTISSTGPLQDRCGAGVLGVAIDAVHFTRYAKRLKTHRYSSETILLRSTRDPVSLLYVKLLRYKNKISSEKRVSFSASTELLKCKEASRAAQIAAHAHTQHTQEIVE